MVPHPYNLILLVAQCDLLHTLLLCLIKRDEQCCLALLLAPLLVYRAIIAILLRFRTVDEIGRA